MRYTLLISLFLLILSSGCVCFLPCPMSPSGYGHLGCLPPGITMYYQNEEQTQEQPKEENKNGIYPSSEQ